MDYIMYNSCTHRVTMNTPCIECVCYIIPALKQRTETRESLQGLLCESCFNLVMCSIHIIRYMTYYTYQVYYIFKMHSKSTNDW